MFNKWTSNPENVLSSCTLPYVLDIGLVFSSQISKLFAYKAESLIMYIYDNPFAFLLLAFAPLQYLSFPPSQIWNVMDSDLSPAAFCNTAKIQNIKANWQVLKGIHVLHTSKLQVKGAFSTVIH